MNHIVASNINTFHATRNNAGYLFSVVEIMIFILSVFYSEYYVPMVIMLNAAVVFSILHKLGRGIVLRELICLHGCIFCLLMPWIGYEFYTSTNTLSRLWVTYMPVKDDVYFSYALPAMAGFTTAMCWPIRKKGVSDEENYMLPYQERAKTILTFQPQMGLILIVSGILFLFAGPYLPDSLQYFANLLYTSSYAGLLYIYFNKKLPYRKPVILLFAVFICAKALGGMFTEIAYMSIILFSFLFIGKRTALWKKTLIFLVGIFFLVLLQSVKLSYRKIIWGKGTSDNKAVVFSKIMTEKVTNVSSLFDVNSFFPVYVRFNQGYNVAMVLKRFPKFKEHDNGQQLFYNAASSFVPRFLWPDKPMAGGKFNMLYYAGFKITGWSTNVGPLGEAYGSFGVGGGIAFMCCLGLFIRWTYQKIFTLSLKIPLLLFWIPVLFYQITYSLEADTLQILNSIIKSSVFVLILYKSYPPLMGIVKQYTQKTKLAID